MIYHATSLTVLNFLENVLFEQKAEFIQTLYKCIIFNNIFQNLSEDKNEQNKKDQSPKNEQNKKDQSPKNSPSKSNLTPKFAGKRLVSILNPKDVSSKQPTNEQEGKQDAEQERHENDEMSSEKFADHAYDKNKKGSKSITDTQSIETVMESEDNIGNNKSSQVPYNDEDDSPSKTPNKTIDSIFPIDQTIELTKCDDDKCGCNAVHCPFCAPNRFKPTMPSRVRDHLENKHFSHAVQYEGTVCEVITVYLLESHAGVTPSSLNSLLILATVIIFMNKQILQYTQGHIVIDVRRV